MKDKISNQLNTEIKLLSTHPSEIIFRFAEAQNKKVAIQPQVDYTLKDNIFKSNYSKSGQHHRQRSRPPYSTPCNMSGQLSGK